MNFNINDLYIIGLADNFDIYSGNTLIGCCNMDDEAALPFYLSDGKVYYGKNGDEHRSIGYDIIGISPEYIFSLDNEWEIEKYEKMRDAAADKVRACKNALPGRIWTHIRTSNNAQFNFSVMSFWGYNSEVNNKVDRNLIKQIIDHVGVDENNLFITKFDDKRDQGTLVKYTEWNAYVPKMSDTQKKAYAIHLMKSKDKHNATSDFRTNRDRNIGKKLTNDKGQEMPVAQYRNIIYGENKKYMNMKKQIIKLTEQDLHNIIKESVKRILKESNFSDNDLSWRAKNYQDERDKFLTNPDYTGTPSQFDPNNYREAEDFVDDEESGLFDTIKGQGYKGVTDDDSIYTNVGNFNKLTNITRQHLRNNPIKPHLH